MIYSVYIKNDPCPEHKRRNFFKIILLWVLLDHGSYLYEPSFNTMVPVSMHHSIKTFPANKTYFSMSSASPKADMIVAGQDENPEGLVIGVWGYAPWHQEIDDYISVDIGY